MALLKTRSAVRRADFSGHAAARYRKPFAWRRLRSSISGPVSRERLACMIRRRAGVAAHEAAAAAEGEVEESLDTRQLLPTV